MRVRLEMLQKIYKLLLYLSVVVGGARAQSGKEEWDTAFEYHRPAKNLSKRFLLLYDSMRPKILGSVSEARQIPEHK